MKRRTLLSSLAAAPLLAADDYPLGAESQRQPNVPRGKVIQMPEWKSTIFPGTVRDWWIYVPAQYDAAKPAPVMILQDGGGWIKDDGAIRMPVVLDNLIHKGDLPALIAIFINPGVLPALKPDAQPRFNRSFEYDGLGDRYARFIIEEILPEVRKQYNLSSDPNHYAIGGSSSGASCAFTAAWNRPDQFRRVLSWVGSFVDLRGADQYAARIRKTEPKPLRIFLQDGKNDLNIYSGSWFIANQEIYAALTYAGYDAKFAIGDEGHNSKHGAAVLPDSLRWLWRDFPKPVEKSKGGSGERQIVRDILDPDSDWEVVSSGHKFTDGPTADRDGNVYFSDVQANTIHRIDARTGAVTLFTDNAGGVSGLAFGPDGRLYACQNRARKVVAWTIDDRKVTVLAEDVAPNDLCVDAHNNVYFTDPPPKKVWLITAQGERRAVVDKGIEYPNGVRLSPDQSLLLVSDYRDRVVWSYQILADGSVANGQPFYRLEADEAIAGGDGMTVDTEGFLYVTSRLGIQICDQPGRVNAILNPPQRAALPNITFGGPGFTWLYATNGDKVYRRHLRRQGTVAWAPNKPPTPRL